MRRRSPTGIRRGLNRPHAPRCSRSRQVRRVPAVRSRSGWPCARPVAPRRRPRRWPARRRGSPIRGSASSARYEEAQALFYAGHPGVAAAALRRAGDVRDRPARDAGALARGGRAPRGRHPPAGRARVRGLPDGGAQRSARPGRAALAGRGAASVGRGRARGGRLPGALGGAACRSRLAAPPRALSGPGATRAVQSRRPPPRSGSPAPAASWSWRCRAGRSWCSTGSRRSPPLPSP